MVVRHPMPYGDLRTQAVQRFSSYDDFERHQCTIEEREEYEPLVDQGIVVYAGVDYGQILNQEEKEAEGKRCQLLEARRASFGIAWSKPWIYQKRFRLSEKGFRQQPVTTWHFDKPVRYLAWCRRE